MMKIMESAVTVIVVGAEVAVDVAAAAPAAVAIAFSVAAIRFSSQILFFGKKINISIIEIQMITFGFYN